MGSEHVVRPILMQRTCDGGKGDMTSEEWARVIADRLANGTPAQGCGTTFQWYWGNSQVMCPNCGRTWLVMHDDIRKYGLVDAGRPLDNRELIERVARDVLVRLGNRY